MYKIQQSADSGFNWEDVEGEDGFLDYNIALNRAIELNDANPANQFRVIPYTA